MSLTMPLDVLLGIEHFMHKNCEHWEFFVYKCILLKSKKILKLLYVFPKIIIKLTCLNESNQPRDPQGRVLDIVDENSCYDHEHICCYCKVSVVESNI